MPPAYDVSMSNFPLSVVIPHARFVEYQDKRRKKAAQPIRPDSSSTIDIDIAFASAARIPEMTNGAVNGYHDS